MRLPNDDELRELDDELSTEGISIQNRPMVATSKWATKNGVSPLEVLSEIPWFLQQFSKLHPSVNFKPQPFAVLSVSARGVSYELNPPLVFGFAKVDPMKSVAIKQQELERIHANDSAAFWEMYYQAADGLDLFMGNQNLPGKTGESEKMMAVGFSHLEAAARQLNAGAIDASIAHAACVAVETLTKGVLREKGLTSAQLISLGHDFKKIAKTLTQKLPGPNDSEYLTVFGTMPNLVSSRYNPPVLNMVEAQDIYRRALFLCAEPLRRNGRDSIYRKLANDQTVPRRKW